MIPVKYLTPIEKYLLQSIKDDIGRYKSRQEKQIIEEALDDLLKRALKRYKQEEAY